MSAEPDDRAIAAVVEYEATKLAAACRALGSLAMEQRYHNGPDADAILEHVADLLDQLAHGRNWDSIRCQDARSIEELRNLACGVGNPTHDGPGKLRMFPSRQGGVVKLWACDACWAEVEGLRPAGLRPA